MNKCTTKYDKDIEEWFTKCGKEDHTIWFSRKPNFCPFCGDKLEEGEKEQCQRKQVTLPLTAFD